MGHMWCVVGHYLSMAVDRGSMLITRCLLCKTYTMQTVVALCVLGARSHNIIIMWQKDWMDSLYRKLHRISQDFSMKTENVVVLKRKLHRWQLNALKHSCTRVTEPNRPKILAPKPNHWPNPTISSTLGRSKNYLITNNLLQIKSHFTYARIMLLICRNITSNWLITIHSTPALVAHFNSSSDSNLLEDSCDLAKKLCVVGILL